MPRPSLSSINTAISEKSTIGIMTFMDKYWRQITRPGQATEQRVFAVLEAICKPVSFLALGGALLFGLLRWNGIELPVVLIDYVMPILLSAAIGYLTNWVAIEMLFRPYEKTLRHPFALLTLGYWRQGLIPKNKEAIAEKIAMTAERELIRPQVLAKDLCGMVGELLENKTVLCSIRSIMQSKMLEHSREIADYLAPRIEKEVITEMGRLFTADNVRKYWNTQIEPMLKSEDTKDRLADIMANFIATHSSDLADEIRPALVRMIQEYCQEKGGAMFGSMMFKMADYMTSGILSKETLGEGIKNWVEKPGSLTVIREKMALVMESCREYVVSSRNDDAIGAFVNGLCKEFKCYVHEALSARLQPAIIQIAQSEELWDSLVNQIPKCKPEVETFVSSYGLSAIIEKLNISGRNHEAIIQQDMPAFHKMINEISSQHLCAIQVLGFFLGGIAGSLLVWLK